MLKDRPENNQFNKYLEKKTSNARISMSALIARITYCHQPSLRGIGWSFHTFSYHFIHWSPWSFVQPSRDSQQNVNGDVCSIGNRKTCATQLCPFRCSVSFEYPTLASRNLPQYFSFSQNYPTKFNRHYEDNNFQTRKVFEHFPFSVAMLLICTAVSTSLLLRILNT